MTHTTAVTPPPLWACSPEFACDWLLWSDCADEAGDDTHARLARAVAGLLADGPKLVLSAVRGVGTAVAAIDRGGVFWGRDWDFLGWRTPAQTEARWAADYGPPDHWPDIRRFLATPGDFPGMPPALALSWHATLVAEHCHARLDATPADQAARGLLADALEWEGGHEDEVACLRWCVREGKWPALVELGPDVARRWWLLTPARQALGCRDPDDIPLSLCVHLRGATDTDYFEKPYPSRREAESALAAAWAAAREGGWTP